MKRFIRINLDIGIFAHNEEQNIENAIKSVQASNLEQAVKNIETVLALARLNRAEWAELSANLDMVKSALEPDKKPKKEKPS